MNIKTCARIGGEELAAILPETGLADALLAAERLRARIERSNVPTEHAEVSLKVTVSIGIAVFPRCGESLESLLSEADRLLYQVKRSGRNRVASPRPRDLARAQAA